MDKRNVDFIANGYNEYYHSGLYEKRYPFGNFHVISRINSYTKKLSESNKLLDYGCGNGRYLSHLIENSDIKLYGFDVSDVAISQAKLRFMPYQKRLSLFHSIETLEEVLSVVGYIDLGLLLFGVLAHIEGKGNRVDLLNWLLRTLKPDGGTLLVSVPNKWRRFTFLQVFRFFQDHPKGDGIHYTRVHSNRSVSLYYHLYTVQEIVEELEAVGFTVNHVSAESILPEKWVSRYSWIAQFDHLLCRFLPAWIGYGILVEARRKSE